MKKTLDELLEKWLRRRESYREIMNLQLLTPLTDREKAMVIASDETISVVIEELREAMKGNH